MNTLISDLMPISLKDSTRQTLTQKKKTKKKESHSDKLTDAKKQGRNVEKLCIPLLFCQPEALNLLPFLVVFFLTILPVGLRLD